MERLKRGPALRWRWILNAACIVAIAACAAPLLWAGAILVSQAAWWFRTGGWQPVPLGALLVQPDFSYLWTPGLPQHGRPLDLVPSLASFPDVDSAADAIAGQWHGGARVVRWFLERSLVGCVLLLELAAYSALMAKLER